MSIESKNTKPGVNDPLEFTLNWETRQKLKECYLARWHASGETRNRATGAPEVADVWLNSCVDFLTQMGYDVKRRST